MKINAAMNRVFGEEPQNVKPNTKLSPTEYGHRKRAIQEEQILDRYIAMFLSSFVSLAI